jgi:hypothetical protein
MKKEKQEGEAMACFVKYLSSRTRGRGPSDNSPDTGNKQTNKQTNCNAFSKDSVFGKISILSPLLSIRYYCTVLYCTVLYIWGDVLGGNGDEDRDEKEGDGEKRRRR